LFGFGAQPCTVGLNTVHPDVMLENKKQAAILFNAIDKVTKQSEGSFYTLQNRRVDISRDSRCDGIEGVSCGVITVSLKKITV